MTGSPTVVETLTQLPAAGLGTSDKPIVMALPPNAREDQISGGDVIARQLADLTEYVVVTVAPSSEAALIEAMGRGDVHIAVLSPFAYVLAHQRGFADAALVSLRSGAGRYGAQFIANVDSGFTSYYDAASGQNTADAAVALKQFDGKKPCWDDPVSPSGYVIPAGFLGEHGIRTKPAAFVQGHPTVVRAVYAKGICDFGAGYIDARTFPSLKQDFPDVMDRVVVIWRIPSIIPYDNISYAANLPEDIRQNLTGSFLTIMDREEGKTALRSVYQIEGLQAVEDTYYNELRVYLEASGIDLAALIQ
jgi:phosphonate transport system substrate-binding protein